MSSNEMTYTLVEEARSIIAGHGNDPDKLMDICRMLEKQVSHYDWVGFYVADPSEEVLHLGPFVGAPTDHVLIPFGKGICGQAAKGKRTFIIQDVTKENNYLSCSSEVRSEIVLPVMDAGEVIGELDIDSHEISPFTDPEREILERICSLCVPLVRSYRDGLGQVRLQA